MNNFLLGMGQYLALNEKLKLGITNRISSGDINHPSLLVVGTCGGSVSAAIIYIFPDPKELKLFVKTKVFYQFIYNRKLSQNYQQTFSKILLRTYHSSDYFSHFTFHLPQKFSFKINEKNQNQYYFNKTLYNFSANPEIATLEKRFIKMMSSSIYDITSDRTTSEEKASIFYGWRKKIDIMFFFSASKTTRKDLENNTRPLFDEVIVSSNPTGINQKIATMYHQKSFIGEWIKSKKNAHDPIVNKLVFNNQFTLHDALRSAVAEPAIIEPFYKKNDEEYQFYMAGSINAMPIEYVDLLADGYSINDLGPATAGMGRVFKNLYGYSFNERRDFIRREIQRRTELDRQYNRSPRYQIIDLVDIKSKLRKKNANLAPATGDLSPLWSKFTFREFSKNGGVADKQMEEGFKSIN